MNDRLFFSKKCDTSFEPFEDTSSSNNTIMETLEGKPSCDNGRNELCPVEVSDAEERILSWLHKNQITMAIPEEKEMQYYEQKKKSLVLQSRKSSSLIQESPLMQRRRGSMTNLHSKQNERESSLILNASPIKLSKFNTSKYLDICFKEYQDSQ